MNEFSRTELLIGKDALEKLKNSTVAIFGIGGVGGYVLEGLVRCGVGNFILVDNDTVSLTNINRQIIATHETIDKPKVQVAKERALLINPSVNIKTYEKLYLPEERWGIFDDKIDYIVDAIDNVTAKLDLVMEANRLDIPIMSSMGTGNKLNPTMLLVSDIKKTEVCPLAKVIRTELRKRGVKKLKVVYSKELPIKPEVSENKENMKYNNRQAPGSISFVPSVAGLIIASEVVKDLIKE